MDALNLAQYDIAVDDVFRNLAPPILYAEAIREDPRAAVSDLGALIAYSGAKTGRSPGDKRIVREPSSEKDVWWGNINIPITPEVFLVNRTRARDYLNTRDRKSVV